MKRTCCFAILLCIMMPVTVSVGTLSPVDGHCIFTGTYLTKELETGRMREQINASFFDTSEGFMLTTYNTKEGKEKRLSCMIDKNSMQLSWVHQERTENDHIYQSADLKMSSQGVQLSVTGEDAGENFLKFEDDTLYTLPDTLHTLLGLRQIEKGTEQKVCVVGWNGKHLTFVARGEGVITVDGQRYRMVSLNPQLPLGVHKVLNWNNVFLFIDEDPHFMAVFKGKQGPFADPIVMWLEGEEQLAFSPLPE